MMLRVVANTVDDNNLSNTAMVVAVWALSEHAIGLAMGVYLTRL